MKFIIVYFLFFPCLMIAGDSHTIGLSKCRAGMTPIGDTNECVYCPSGFYCNSHSLYPIECSEGYYSLQGSTKCCPKNQTCPVGYAVDTHRECSCTLIKCQSESHVLVFNMQNENIQCKPLPKHCNYCSSSGYVLMEDTCFCIENKKCQSQNKKHYWFTPYSRGWTFRCMNFV